MTIVDGESPALLVAVVGLVTAIVAPLAIKSVDLRANLRKERKDRIAKWRKWVEMFAVITRIEQMHWKLY